MAELKSGVLFKLLEEMGVGKVRGVVDFTSVLLQIRSIIPVLASGGLWPNKGFFLRISDASHSMYVLLPREQNDLVLSDKLQIGQLIFVEKLEFAYPVPMIKGIRPTSGRRPCTGDPIDLIPKERIEKFCGVSDDSNLLTDQNYQMKRPRRTRWNSSSISETQFDDSGFSEKLSRVSEDDTESTVSNFSYLSSSSRTKNCIKLPERQRRRREYQNSYMESPSPSPRYTSVPKRVTEVGSESVRWAHSSIYGSKDKTCLTQRSNVVEPSVPSRSKVESSLLPRHNMESPKYSASRKRSWIEAEITWDSLPPNVINLGMEVMKQRDIYIHDATEALLQTFAAERILKCIRSYSELQIEDTHYGNESIAKYFRFHEELCKGMLIIQSLTETSDNSDMFSLGNKRREKAAFWIKEAVATDLDSVSILGNKQMQTPNKKGISLIVQNNENCSGNVNEGKNNQCSLSETMLELGNLLKKESRSWYLGRVEKYLDEICIGTKWKEMNKNRMAETMSRVKRVSDWLDAMDKGDEIMTEIETEACTRMKNKIYRILLKHVETIC